MFPIKEKKLNDLSHKVVNYILNRAALYYLFHRILELKKKKDISQTNLLNHFSLNINVA